MPEPIRGNPVREQLRTLDDAALEAVIRADFFTGCDVSPLAEAAAELLAQRNGQDIDPEAAWKRFARENLDGEKAATPPMLRKGHSRLLRTAACVAAMLSLLVVTVYATGFHHLVARWTEDIFSFGDPTAIGERKITLKEPELSEEPIGLGSLQALLDTHGVTEVKEPTALPAGLQLEYAEEIPSPSGYVFNATYTDVDHRLSIVFSNYEDEPHTCHEATGSTVEQDAYKGQAYYRMQNIITNKIVWATDSFDCSLEGNYTCDELTAIFESMIDAVD